MTEDDALIQDVEAKVGHPYHKTIFERIPREDVKKLINAGFSQNQIAEYYGVSSSAIRHRMHYDEW